MKPTGNSRLEAGRKGITSTRRPQSAARPSWLCCGKIRHSGNQEKPCNPNWGKPIYEHGMPRVPRNVDLLNDFPLPLSLPPRWWLFLPPFLIFVSSVPEQVSGFGRILSSFFSVYPPIRVAIRKSGPLNQVFTHLHLSRPPYPGSEGGNEENDDGAVECARGDVSRVGEWSHKRDRP